MAKYKALPQERGSMARDSQQPTADDSTETQTLRDVYGAVDMDDLEAREEYDPALLPDGAVPEEAPDGRDYHTAAWDGGVSDLEAADGPYSTEEGAPAVLVYVSNQGGVQVHEGEVVTCSGRVVTVEADDGTLRTAHAADIAGREEAVHNHAGADSRFIGTMLEVRLVESWDDYERRMELLEEARQDDDDEDDDPEPVEDDGDDGDDGPDRLDTPQWKDRMGDLRTDGGREAVTADDLLVSDTVTGTRHAYLEGENRALCGHRRTRRNFDSVAVKEAPDAAWRTIECDNCLRSLAGRYRSVHDEWEALRALEEDDVVHVYTEDGDSVEAVVTSAADELDPDHLGTLYVRLTTDPDTVSYLRDVGDDLRLRCTEGAAPTLDATDLLEELDENPERTVSALEVVGTHDHQADEDPEQRRAVRQAAEQVAAEHDRMAEGTASSEEYLFNLNYASAVREVAYRLRGCDWPLSWVRQKVERKAENLADYPEEVHEDPEATRDDYAKASGKRAGYQQALALLEEYAPVEDAGEVEEARTDGGSDLRGGYEPDETVEHEEYGVGTVRAHPDGEHRETEARAYVYFEDTPETTLRRVWVSKLSRVARTDGGQEAASERTTPVDGGVIHDVAQTYTFGAGHLKAALERIGADGDLTTDSLEDLDDDTREAARKALEITAIDQAEDLEDLEGETFYSDEFAAPVEVGTVHTGYPDDVLRGVQPVSVVKSNGATETTSLDTLVLDQPEADDLETGDLVRLPDGTALYVEGVAPADEAPESGVGPLYQAQVRPPEGRDKTLLYGPHNLRAAFEAGAVYAGNVPVEERRPFWCDGCDRPHRAGERRDDPLVDGVACSYGCSVTVQQDALAARLDDEADR
ncbi:ORF 55 [Haloarcula hispanica virus SH1]|uniref:ORF 55 n=1 Tax=Haloarcula hispanica SH1 virus TaxID=326574 RepID=Q4KPD2_9VIRU|nr:ORF 55 [Haloarcula hispanica virus SH1]AAY24981.1 ORF 55 [Haloarcula hispanica virus SH1]